MVNTTYNYSLFAFGFFIGFFMSLVILLSIDSQDFDRFVINSKICVLDVDCVEYSKYSYDCKNVYSEDIMKVFGNRKYKLLNAESGEIFIKLIER